MMVGSSPLLKRGAKCGVILDETKRDVRIDVRAREHVMQISPRTFQRILSDLCFFS